MLRRGFRIALLSALICALPAVRAFADSQVRIVRLSDLNGDVLIDRNSGEGFERALLNMPIVQGTKLWTKSGDARAEVEFESGNTVRLTPGSQVSFPQLSLRDSGAKASTVEVGEGTVYFNVKKDKEDEFRVVFGHEQINVPKSASFRIDMAKDQVRIAVLKGDVEVQGASGTVEISKDKTATFDAGANTSTVAKGVAPEPFDKWNKDESKYQQQYASAGSPYRTPFSYGVSDLNYYGNYSYISPYGWVWQPFGVSAGWNPYMNGAWSYYPGFGYSWVSTYPWGWLPYRYGAWAFIPGWGWGWQPGAHWGGWLNSPVLINPPAGFVAPRAPMGGKRTVLVNPPAEPTKISTMPRVVNGGGNRPVNGRILNPVVEGGRATQVQGAPLTPRRGGMPSSVHGTTVDHGLVAPRPAMRSGGSLGGFGRSSGGFGPSAAGHVGAPSSAGSHASSAPSGSHASPK